ncbi:hypothetical protein EX30DRAFT_397957 [Ascodesmis nigricans]|uniref:Mid2 domain-containing protein n=1 Tax=Ascodesmis nigricans TaxID=341454 RepID=A0A4S2MRX9_9PEZI|nr:hypothetical protein EX30DRAFT_397957 [Ascodesmis nigricans]
MASAPHRLSALISLLLLLPVSLSAPHPLETELARTDGKGYYPAGRSYDDPLMDQAGPNGDGTEAGNDGHSKGSFMSMSLGAQIGIIVSVVVVALVMFGGAVVYYIRRRRVWEKEGRRSWGGGVLKSNQQDHTRDTSLSSLREVKNTVTITSKETGQTSVRLKPESEAINLPPQTPTWKRWMVKDV